MSLFFMLKKKRRWFLPTPKFIEPGKNAFVVLSVGIAKGGIPLVTVEASPENLCYRLPVQLNEWAMTLVSMANTGEDLFPAEVIFTKAENRIYADII